jgi:hypothetical protein
MYAENRRAWISGFAEYEGRTRVQNSCRSGETCGEGGGDGCDTEGCGKKKGAVFLVSLEVERGIGVDDSKEVVYSPRIIERE